MKSLERLRINLARSIGFLIFLAAGLVIFQNCAPTSDEYPFSQASAPAPIAPNTSNPVNPPISQTSGDPGFGTGLWVPPGLPNRTVADPSGSYDLRVVNYIPGCLNGLTANNSFTGCSAKSSFTGLLANSGRSHSFSFGSGRQLMIRLKPRPGAGVANDSLALRSETGGRVVVYARIWLTVDPTASFNSVSEKCRAFIFDGGTNPAVLTGPGYCPISDQIPIYYLGIEYDEASSERFQVMAGGHGSDFY